MNRIESAFFNALQHSIAGLPLSEELFVGLTADEWRSLHKLSRNQGVLALVFDALKDINNLIPAPIKLQWAYGAIQIEDRSDKQWHLADEIGREFCKHNIKPVVLKGFALSKYYPNPKHRECGDFDCFLPGGFELGNRIAEQLGAHVRFDDYKHSHINYKGLMIENHKFCTAIRGPKINKQFEIYLQQLLQSENGGLTQLNNSSIYTPSPTFNALFLIRHSMVHFLYEGIKIRHILDWACLIKSEKKNIDWDIVWHWCDLLHLGNFLDLLNATVGKYIGIDIECRHAQSAANIDKFMQGVLYDDTAVYNNAYATIWHQRYAIAKNMVTTRWKFSDVYKKSLILELLKTAMYALFEKHPKL